MQQNVHRKMKNAAADLENRRPVWDAMSELFLDTELQHDDHERIAKALGNSPYSQIDLNRIMFREVYPVLINNLWSVAGEWDGFDSSALHAAILRRLALHIRLPSVCIPGRWLMQTDWRIVKGMLAPTAEHWQINEELEHG